MNNNKKKVYVDLSTDILREGYINLLKKISSIDKVINHI